MMLNWLKYLGELTGLSDGSILFIILIFLSIFVEITPIIKFNPISWISNIIYKPIYKYIDTIKIDINKDINSVRDELKEEIDQIKLEQTSEKDSINELVKSIEMNEISRIRWEIIEFSNTLENGQLHIRDEYRHIIDDNKRYHSLIKKYGLENGVIDEEFEKIKNHYESNKNSPAVYF